MKVIDKKNNRVTIEHNNKRVVLLPQMYDDYQNGDLTPDDLLELGMPLSVMWSDFITVSVTAKQIEAELHKRGIHTEEDLLKNMGAVNGAVLAAININASSIYKNVKRSKNL